MYESEGKETINLEMTSDIILAHPPTYRQVHMFIITRKRDSENQLSSIQYVLSRYILEKTCTILNLKSSRCDLGPKSSYFRISKK